MGIISKLKSVLGVADDRPSRPGDGGTSIGVGREPEAAGERAVKGGHASEQPAEERESPAEEAEPAATSAPGPAADPVDSIKGIGPAYAERIEGAGVTSVADLAAADPDDLAAATDLGTGRVANWIERARARVEKERQ